MIRYMWYVFESRSFIQAQISLKIHFTYMSVSNNEYDK